MNDRIAVAPRMQALQSGVTHKKYIIFFPLERKKLVQIFCHMF